MPLSIKIDARAISGASVFVFCHCIGVQRTRQSVALTICCWQWDFETLWPLMQAWWMTFGAQISWIRSTATTAGTLPDMEQTHPACWAVQMMAIQPQGWGLHQRWAQQHYLLSSGDQAIKFLVVQHVSKSPTFLSCLFYLARSALRT